MCPCISFERPWLAVGVQVPLSRTYLPISGVLNLVSISLKDKVKSFTISL